MKRKQKCSLKLFCCFSCSGLNSLFRLPCWNREEAFDHAQLHGMLYNRSQYSHAAVAHRALQCGISCPHSDKPLWCTDRTQCSTIQSRAWPLLRTHEVVKTKIMFDLISVKINNFSTSNPQPDTKRPCFRIGPLFYYENKCLSYCHKNHPALVNESLFPMGIILCTWTLISFWCSRLGFKNNFNLKASVGRAL